MFKIRKTDEDKHLVYGEVYSPNCVDTHGEMMLKEDIELIAHRFLQHASLTKSIDTQHDNKSCEAYPVESFIARKDDPDYAEGAWVLGVKIECDTLWDQVKKGELNGFSLEAWVTKVNAVVEMEIDPEVIGETEESDDHTHLFFAQMNDDGKVYAGRTTTVNNHSHEIIKASATE